MSSAGRLDIEPSDLALVRDILIRHIADRQVLAFGSRTKGRARPYSDLDLCILGEDPVNAAILSALAEDFSDSALPFKVDVVDWATASPSFRAIIDKADRVIIHPAS